MILLNSSRVYLYNTKKENGNGSRLPCTRPALEASARILREAHTRELPSAGMSVGHTVGPPHPRVPAARMCACMRGIGYRGVKGARRAVISAGTSRPRVTRDKLAANTESQPKPQGPLSDILQDPPPPSMWLVGYENTHGTEQV